jgi:hypothetical protein
VPRPGDFFCDAPAFVCCPDKYPNACSVIEKKGRQTSLVHSAGNARLADHLLHIFDTVYIHLHISKTCRCTWMFVSCHFLSRLTNPCHEVLKRTGIPLYLGLATSTCC